MSQAKVRGGPTCCNAPNERERERQMAQTGVQETRGKTWGFEQRELYETEFIGTYTYHV